MEAWSESWAGRARQVLHSEYQLRLWSVEKTGKWGRPGGLGLDVSGEVRLKPYHLQPLPWDFRQQKLGVGQGDRICLGATESSFGYRSRYPYLWGSTHKMGQRLCPYGCGVELMGSKCGL